MNLTFTRGDSSQSFYIAGQGVGIVGGPLRIILYASSISDMYSFFSIAGNVTVVNCKAPLRVMRVIYSKHAVAWVESVVFTV